MKLVYFVLCSCIVIFNIKSFGQNHFHNEWLEDLEYISARILENHPDPFNEVSKEKYNRLVKNVKKAIFRNDPDKILARISILGAHIGDGHTYIGPKKFNVLPIRTYIFDDGQYITQAPDSLNYLIGAKLIGVNNIPIKRINRRLSELIPRDSKEQLKAKLPAFLTIFEYLKGLSIIPIESNTCIINFKLNDGKRKSVVLSPISLEQYFKDFELIPSEFENFLEKDFHNYFTFAERLPRNDKMYFTSNPGSMYWHTIISKSLYFQYNFVRNGDIKIIDYIKKLDSVICSQKFEKIIIDIRTNPGGNNSLNALWIDFFKQVQNYNSQIEFYVIIGRHSFSAATDFIASCENILNVIFVGEPSGGSPNHYGNPKTFNSPNFKLQLSISTFYWQHVKPTDMRESTFPTIIPKNLATNYFNNKDPFLRSILIN